jgi:hypothetical protein
VEQGYLKDPKFLAYLDHLNSYMSTPQYAVLLQYPNGLQILRLLLREDFRRQLNEATGSIIDYIHKQQYHHWHHLNQ